MNASALAQLDATAQAAACESGESSPDELLQACLARVDALNPLLRALVTVAPEERRARQGEPAPLAGVPFVVKDAMAWPGMRRAMGARLLAGHTGRQQTPYGRALTAAGLVCVGKSAMSELGLLASTETLLEGITHNPWDLSLSPAGSSGGSAVAVAAGLVPLAHASDGGGSIRLPASVCGVFGFKPSTGRSWSTTTVSSDLQEMTVDHCVSRSVRDSALWLALTETRAPGAPMIVVREPPGRKLRIGTWTRTLWDTEPEPAVESGYQQTCALLGALGHAVELVAPPVFDTEPLADAFFMVLGAAVAALIATIDKTRDEPVQRHELEPFTWALAEEFLARGDDALVRARENFARAVSCYAEATRGYDVVFTPTIPIVPWPIGYLSPVVDAGQLKQRVRRVLGYTPLHNVFRGPAMSVPLCFTPEGLPVGMHFAAARGEDALLMGLAYQLEEARPWAHRWPRHSVPALAAQRDS